MTATKDNIISLPNEHLRERSKKVGTITPEVKKIIKDMKAATIDWEKSRKHEVGVALAAVQIDQLSRIIIVRNNVDDKKDTKFGVFINPEITKTEGPINREFEGCLSVPDIYGKVPRHNKVRVKALDEHGKPVRLKAEGFLAVVFQHEIDHLNGKVFIDRIKNSKGSFYRLEENGDLTKLDYDKEVKTNDILWK